MYYVEEMMGKNQITMELNEKIELVDKVLIGLVNANRTVPEIIDGNNKFPISRSEKDWKYRIIEQELIKLELAKKLRGGDNSTIGGYIVFKLLPKGFDLVDSIKSVAELYDEFNSSQSEVNSLISNVSSSSKKIFIVHGHNNEMKESVARLIEKVKLTPVILHEQANGGKTVIEKLLVNSLDIAFAIVLLSADDMGYDKTEKPQTAKLRARQNVIFELGLFIGQLGRERVIALMETEVGFEKPSDYNGVIFVKYDSANNWKFELIKEFKEIGIPVSADDLF
jgi:predicted nucleotide-binding protein